MRTRTPYLLASFLMLSASAHALVRPVDGTALADYDVRGTLRGVALGASPGKLRARMGGAQAPVLAQAKAEALARLKAAVPGDVQVRWDALTEAPAMLFSYDRPLTSPDGRDAADIARGFLGDYAELFGFTPDGLAAFHETRRFTTKDATLTILHLEQAVSGVEVFNGDVRFAITPLGEIASVSTAAPLRSIGGIRLVPSIADADAVFNAAGFAGVPMTTPLARLNPAGDRVGVFEKGPFMSEPTIETVLFPMGASARLAYKIMIERADQPAFYELVVDATDGSLLQRYNITHYVQTDGLVFKEDPGKGPTPGVPTKEKFYDDTIYTDPRWPLGWVTTDQSVGNVVDAHEDWNGDNAGGQHSFDFTPGAPIFFEDPWTNAYETTGNAKTNGLFAITNLFYFANDYHDWTYALGFDEAAGNWQKSNFGRGGVENDWLMADAQDSYDLGTRNNANMSTPADGGHPRAQFYAFTSPFPRRDSDVDSDVVYHEFTHGLSHRLVGNANSASCLSGFQSGAMGEGWSDFYACSRNNDPIMGEYATGDLTAGIRSYPYDAYPLCHKFDGPNFCSTNSCAGFSPACEVHDEGELWAATLWEMRTNLQSVEPANYGAIALRLVTDGMKLTKCNPTFLDARDGILLADRYDYAGAHLCIIWKSFADRYMGYTATTTSGDDTTPVGKTDLPPYCTPATAGAVKLNFDRYSCQDTLIATVHDTDATGPVMVQLSTSSGDAETIPAIKASTSPEFLTAGVPVVVGSPNPGDGTLQVQPGDTITAQYNDASPVGMSTTQATVDCQANVQTTLNSSGGCAPENPVWPVPVPQILDAGEIVDFNILVRNREPRPLTNVQVTLASVSNPMVVPLTTAPVNVGTIPAYTGAGAATFKLAGAQFLTPGTVTLGFNVTADGFQGAKVPVSYTIPVMSDYTVGSGTTGVQDFEAGNGGYTHQPWPDSPGGADEWTYGICAAASGTKAWHCGPAACASNAAEQDANLEAAIVNPLTATRISWYPTKLSWVHNLQLAGTTYPNSDVLEIGMIEPGFLTAGGDGFAFVDLDASSNTGGTFQPASLTYTGADTIGSGMDISQGISFYFDYATVVFGAASPGYSVDDVKLDYATLDAVAQPGSASCSSAGYVGSLAACTGSTYTLSMYNTARAGEMQFAGNGKFWSVGPDWNLFDVEFPTPSAAGEKLVFLANANPDDGAHQGMLCVNGQTIGDPKSQNFGTCTCAAIPTPVGPVAKVAEGQAITISWPPFSESGPFKAIVGYKVYRIDAETFPPATSTINDYLSSGTLVGSTVGLADINKIIDIAPTVLTGSQDEYTYAIQPLFKCDSPGCSAPVAATFGGSETIPGKANLSTDNKLSDGLSGTVKVSKAMLATFDSWSAVRQGSSVLVKWTTTREIDTIAYEVYRGTTADAASMVRVGRKMASGPQTYTFVDDAAPAGTLFYQVRELSMTTPAKTAVFAVTEPVSGRGSATSGRHRAAASGAGNSPAAPAAAPSVNRREGRIR